MATPPRLYRHPFILVPRDEAVKFEHRLRAAQQACRHALFQDMHPLCPLLHYAAFLSQGEILQLERRLQQHWCARADRIWMIYSSDEVEGNLDPTSYDILNRNRKSVRRIPVYRVRHQANEIIVESMNGDGVRELLLQNLSSGYGTSLDWD